MLKAIPAALFVLSAMTFAGAQHAGHAHTMPTPAASASKGPLPLVASGATVVAVPASLKDTSAFMTLKNTTSKSIALVGATATVAGHAMLMNTIQSANMTGMMAANQLVVPAGGTLTLKHTGDHVMLMSLKRPLKVGEVIDIVLKASDGRTLTVKATVKKI